MSFRLIINVRDVRDVSDVRDAAADGASNMAVDEALLASAMNPGALPTLRLYHFHRPTVTFGYGQNVAQAVNETACRDRDIECVRRITGGRALLHQHELTYSITAPPFARSVQSTYQSVTSAVRRALGQLGVPVDPPRTPSEDQTTRAGSHLPCLAVPTGHEITTGGRKIVASAMRFRRRGFLTHGSILWSIDRPLSKQVTLGDQDALPAVGIREVELNAPVFGEAELIEALSSAFEELLGAPALPGALSSEESAHASDLAEKYRSECWTRGRLARSRLVDNSETVW
ncbi:MAG: lipoate--protein ligase family protein [Acidobacteriota bacterium]|nr:MAG: lipoate--protein ligase family protein [Acidobacteriota bacterium]